MAKVRAVIMAGGEGSRLGILTSKRTKPAVPFAGKYRIIDFTLSNCVNSGLFDVMLLAQYRPHSLIEHIGAGGPWDLNRDFTGGVRILTPYKGRGGSDWYLGTADAVQQNFRFIKQSQPDMVLILSGDHIYTMNYEHMIAYHIARQADITIATIRVPYDEAKRYGIIDVNEENRITSFIEKPDHPPSNLANMGVYLFSLKVLDEALWEDHFSETTTHDFGKDILPKALADGKRLFAYPYDGYWIDVGTTESYWDAHMGLLKQPPTINLNDRSWVIHTRTEERPPVRLSRGCTIIDSMIADGCEISPEAVVENSVLSPGVKVSSGAHIRNSILLTDSMIGTDARVNNSIIDKRVKVGDNCVIGFPSEDGYNRLITIGKNSILPDNLTVEPGAVISTDVEPSDFTQLSVGSSDLVLAKRVTYEI